MRQAILSEFVTRSARGTIWPPSCTRAMWESIYIGRLAAGISSIA
jgi:hypothetical protein